MKAANRPRVAVITREADKILLIYRYKDGRVYYVLPGGSLEEGELLEQAAIREIKEETGLEIRLGQKLWVYENNGRLEHYFLATSFSGELGLGADSPEAVDQSVENIYRPEWISLAELGNLPLKPEAVKERILKELLI